MDLGIGRVLRALRGGTRGRGAPAATAEGGPAEPQAPPATWDTGNEAESAAAARQYRACAAAGAQALHRWYRRSTGQWGTAGWWNSANALNAVVQYTQRTGDDTYADVIENTFRAAQRAHPGFINTYYDDNGWWALSWIAAYDLTGQTRYLDAAQSIFGQMAGGWDDTCGGGLWWTTGRTYKNAIPNELFLLLATRLHQHSAAGGKGRDYLGWAKREWEWFQASGMIGPAGLINDGLTSDCRNNGGVTWTYNQGVILGGLAALYEITDDRGYLEQGETIADAVLRDLTSPEGILVEPCERGGGGCDLDQAQFKGIFARNLYDFWRQGRKPDYREFILANARSVWVNDRNARDQFGVRWTGPFDRADAARQSSALDALNAAVGVAQADAK
jgi:predicted alpha-1,6-mannanase (GH76 family)